MLRSTAARRAEAAIACKHSPLMLFGSFGQLQPSGPTRLLLPDLPPPTGSSSWNFQCASAGSKHLALLTDEGHIILVGSNRHGQVGQVSDVNELQPFFYDLDFAEDERPDACSSGCNYTIFYKRGTNRATVVGYNVYGQLGLGHKQILDNSMGFADWHPDAPWWHANKELGPLKIKDIVCGHNHTLVLGECGRVFAVGSNTWGELGLGHRDSPQHPTEIPYFSEKKIKIVQISAGNSWTLFRSEDGHVYGCGARDFGQIQGIHWVPHLLRLTRYQGLKMLRMKHVACGADFGAYLSSKNELFFKGALPDFGVKEYMCRMHQIALPDVGAPFDHVICHGSSGCICARNGAILGFGSNVEGQIVATKSVPAAERARMHRGAMENENAAAALPGTEAIVLDEAQMVVPPPDATGTVTMNESGDALKGIDWRRHMAMGHGFVVIVDRNDVYRDVLSQAGNKPVSLPPPPEPKKVIEPAPKKKKKLKLGAKVTV